MASTPAVSLATCSTRNYARNRRKPTVGWHCLDTRSQIVFLLLFSPLVKQVVYPRPNRRGLIEASHPFVRSPFSRSIRALTGAASLKLSNGYGSFFPMFAIRALTGAASLKLLCLVGFQVGVHLSAP